MSRFYFNYVYLYPLLKINQNNINLLFKELNKKNEKNNYIINSNIYNQNLYKLNVYKYIIPHPKFNDYVFDKLFEFKLICSNLNKNKSLFYNHIYLNDYKNMSYLCFLI